MTTKPDLFQLEREARTLARQFDNGNRAYVIDEISGRTPSEAACIVAVMVADWLFKPANFEAAHYNVGYVISALARRAEEVA